MIIYLGLQFKGMEEMGKDSYATQQMVNDFGPGLDQYKMADSNFLPSIGIVSMARTSSEKEQFFRGDNLNIFEGDDKG